MATRDTILGTPSAQLLMGTLGPLGVARLLFRLGTRAPVPTPRPPFTGDEVLVPVIKGD